MTPSQVNDIIQYYTNLLIIQYNNKPKARATIELFVRTIFANGIMNDIQNAYDVDTAVGKQLDVIGKYVGVDRFYTNIDLINYFGLTTYTEVAPDAMDKFGFTDYADFDDYQYNGTLNYGSVLSQTNKLSDDDFRKIIRLKILQNNINHSHKSIDESVYKIFGDEVVPSSAGGMKMYYFVSNSTSALIQAALLKNLLPRPMGVWLFLVLNVVDEFFGFATYDGYSSRIRGFATYADYDINDGDFITYDRVTV